MEVLFKTKKDHLKRAVFGVLRRSSHGLDRQYADALQRVRPFVLSVLMAGVPSVGWAPVSRAVPFSGAKIVLSATDEVKDETIVKNKEEEKEKFRKTEKTRDGSAAKFVLNNAVWSVVDDLESCLMRYGDRLRPDVDQIVFGLKDLELAKGKESETAKKLWDTAVRTYTGPGRCTRNFKRSVVKMGWTSQMTKQDFQAFDRIVPAWELIPFLDSGKIGSLIPFNMAETDRKNKTMPIEGVVRVNEKGQTRYSHVQVMGPKGAAYGEKKGISQSPEHHRAAGGRIQHYGTAHFYLDKNTLLTVLREMAKRRDMVFILNNNKTELKVFDAGNVPEPYRAVVADHLCQQNIEQNLIKNVLPADALAYRKLKHIQLFPDSTESSRKINIRQMLDMKKTNIR